MKIRTTCAIETNDSKYQKDKQGVMCKHCSHVFINPKTQEPYWMCNKYKSVLKENEENWLIRCDKCMINGDN
jgi:hypothetical protein